MNPASAHSPDVLAERRPGAHRDVPRSQVSVDVLIVAHNSSDVLRDCLASIRRYRPPADTVDLRIHIYDNASQDATAAMVRTEFPEVALHRSRFNAGFGAANNRLARGSDADFLLLLNPDTIWKSDLVTALLQELRCNQDAVLAAPRLVYPDGRLQPSSQLLPGLRYELAEAIRGTKLNIVPGFRGCANLIERVRDVHTGLTEETCEAQFVWATCWLVEADWVKANGLFDERFAQYDEDLDFCYRLRGTNAKALYVPAAELVHIGGASSNEHRKLGLMQEARARYYRVNHGPVAELIYRRVILPVGRFRVRRAAHRHGPDRLLGAG